MKKLVLFDIDGTMIKVEGVSRNALIQSFRDVFWTEGKAATHDFAGKMDGNIIYEVLKDAGFTENEIKNKFDDVKNQYIENFKSKVRKEDIRVKPGIYELVSELAKRDDVILGLLTGNFEHSGRHKIALPELNHYFSFGAFAEDGKWRSELPAVAVARAKAHSGIVFENKDVVIIGDTEHDVTCARVLNSKSIAVATGYYSVEKLKSYNPDYVFENLADTHAALNAIFS